MSSTDPRIIDIYGTIYEHVINSPSLNDNLIKTITKGDIFVYAPDGRNKPIYIVKAEQDGTNSTYGSNAVTSGLRISYISNISNVFIPVPHTKKHLTDASLRKLWDIPQKQKNLLKENKLYQTNASMGSSALQSELIPVILEGGRKRTKRASRKCRTRRSKRRHH